ncbi:MAG TPA: hypothetical protein VF302_10390 [Candidatus Limnocylindrales bacterium]
MTDTGARVLRLVTTYRPPASQPGRIAAYLAAAGVRLVTTPAGWSYADCPECGMFGALTLDADGLRWRSSCGCYGVRPLGEPAAMALFHASAGHAS